MRGITDIKKRCPCTTRQGVEMPARRRLPSDYLIQRMVDSGMTHIQIADQFGVGRSAVSAALSRAGLTEPVRYEDTVPWRVRLEHSRSIHLWMLRVAHRLDHGGKVSEDEHKRFAGWSRDLADQDAVVTYLPDSELGFYWVRRESGDDKYIRPPVARREAC